MTSAYPIINQLKMYLSQTNYKQWPGEYGMEKVEEAVETMQEMQQKIEQLTDELISLEQVAKDRYCTMQTQIERLEDQLSFMTKECKRFEAVVERIATRDYDETAQEFARAALEDDDECE